jgi:hypothetical protein
VLTVSYRAILKEKEKTARKKSRFCYAYLPIGILHLPGTYICREGGFTTDLLPIKLTTRHCFREGVDTVENI